MTATPGDIRGPLSEAAHKRKAEGGGLSYRERQRQRVTCPTCQAPLAQGSLAAHRLRQHGEVTIPPLGEEPDPPTVSYRVSFPRVLEQVTCPVPGCNTRVRSGDNLRRHFVQRHHADTLCILEEGPDPLPRCDRCGMHVKHTALRREHRNSGICLRGAAQQRQREARRRARRAREHVFTINGAPLQRVETFRYLGRPLSSTDEDWPAIYRNLLRARQRWGMVSRVLTHDGADPRVMGLFYKAIVQAVLLYGCETWVLSAAKLNALRGFHNRIARRIARRGPSLDPLTGEWSYPPIEDARAAARLFSLEHYIAVRQASFVDKVATRPLHTLCNQADRLSGSRPRLWWWTQPPLGLDAIPGDAPGEDDVALQ